MTDRAIVEPGLGPDAVARLERARAAWQSARPGDGEVGAAVRRIARARRLRGRRREPWRGRALVTVGVLLLGALAYAATGGRGELARWFSTATSPTATATVVAALAAAPRHAAAPDRNGVPQPAEALPVAPHQSVGSVSVEHRHAPVAAAPSRRRARALPRRTGIQPPTPKAVAGAAASAPAASAEATTGAARPAAKHEATWADVDDALARDDTQRAADALSAIARGAMDATTRAKAQVGLVQLLSADGQCSRARHLALVLGRSPGADRDLVAHALAATARCVDR